MPQLPKLLPILAAATVLHTPVIAQITTRSEDSEPTALKQFFYSWNGWEFQWYGQGIEYAESSDWTGAPESGESFSNPYALSTFAHDITAVRYWNTADAIDSIQSSPASPGARAPFLVYLDSLNDIQAGDAQPLVNKHPDATFGFGVENYNNDVDGNRRDKIDDPGEALIIRFDLEGEMNMADAPGNFGPVQNQSFAHTGMNPDTRLILEEVYMLEYSTGNVPQDGRIDFIFYDVSENTFIQDSFGNDAIHEYYNFEDSNYRIPGPWVIEHGDILVFAHPTNTNYDLSFVNAELWGMTFDMEFVEPAREPLDVPSNAEDFPQHPYEPGFLNTWRTLGEEIATYRTEQGNNTIRSVVLGFHRGHLITDNRGSSVGNSLIFFDIADITSEEPSVSNPDNRTLDEVFIERMDGAMHQSHWLAPDHRVNHPGTSYMNMHGLSDPNPSIEAEMPAGFQNVGGSARSAYLLPYHYVSSDGGKAIVDARTDQTLSIMNEHGFGSDAVPIPVGNILLLAKVRSGEKAIATYDISDPRNPILLDIMRGDDNRWRNQRSGAYEPAVYNNYFIIPMSAGGSTIGFVDYTDPANLRMHHVIADTQGSTRYIQFQDHRMFAGTEVIDLTHLDGGITPSLLNVPGHKGEYMLPLGNLVVCAENSEQGAENMGKIYAFQEEPDVLPPSVSFHIPAADSVGQLVTSRIGLMIHETLDITTIKEDTLRVYPASERTSPDNVPNSIPGTRTVSDKDVITFTPLQDLLPNTTYEVYLKDVTDIVGNPMEEYTFQFTTAGPNDLWYPEIASMGLTTAEPLVGAPVSFEMQAIPSNGESLDTLEYYWDFGDGNFSDWSSDNATVTHTYVIAGTYTIRGRVRSVNAPEKTSTKLIQPSIYYKPAGEDGFEPILEAEYGSGTGFSIMSNSNSSNGQHIDGNGGMNLGWDFDAVPGNFQFVVRASKRTENAENRSVGVFFGQWRDYADGTSEVINEVKIGVITANNEDFRDYSVLHTIAEPGSYRLELRDTEDTSEPNVDYLEIRLMGEVKNRMEAEDVSDEFIFNGSRASSSDASENEYVDPRGGFVIQWQVNAEEEGTQKFAFRVKSNNRGRLRGLGVFVFQDDDPGYTFPDDPGNDKKQASLTTTSSSFTTITLDLDLKAGTNYIQLRDSESMRELDVDYIGMVAPPPPAPVIPDPRQSSQLALDSANDLIISVNPDNDTITAVDRNTLQVVWEKDVPGNPQSLAIDNQGRIWVTQRHSDSIRILDTSNPQNDIDLDLGYGAEPHDIVFNRAGTNAYVSLYGLGEVIQIDASSLGLIDRVQTGPYPAAIAIRAEEEGLLVSRFISPTDFGEVYTISLDSGSGAMTLGSTIRLAKDTTSEDGPNTGRGVPNYLSHIAINPADEKAYIASQKVNTVAGAFREQDSRLNHDSTVRPIVSAVNLQTNSETFAERIDLNDLSQPMAICFDERGDYMFVALQGSNSVSVFNTGSMTQVFSLPVGLAPQGLLFDADTQRLFVKNFMDRSVTVHDLSDALATGTFTNTQRTDISTVSNDVLEGEILLGKQIFYNAADERMSFEGYISCAACHQNGGHDGVVWDFTQRGEGLRNTTDLRGRAGMGHGNVHWSGNFDEIQDFELDMVFHQSGTGFIDGGEPNPSMGAPNSGRSAELDALAAYVASLGKETVSRSPHRQADGTMSPEALHGKRLFEGQITPISGHTLSCIECHASDQQFTNSQLVTTSGLGNSILHRVGTIKSSSGDRLGENLVGIDTPTLWDVSGVAPYLHDGSAPTLEAVFEQFDDQAQVGESGAAHNLGDSGYDLTEEEFASLMAYLHQIDGTDLAKMDSQTWFASWGDDIGDESADFDGDRVDNFTEYVLGGDPTQDDRQFQLAKIVNEGGDLSFGFNRRGNDSALRYTVKQSANLSEWSDYMTIDQTTLPSNEVLEEILLEIPMDTDRGFYRLEVTTTDTPVQSEGLNLIPSIQTISLPDAGLTSNYNAQLSALSGDGNLSWTLIDGALPDGLTLSQSGLLSGTLNQVGMFSFTVQVEDTDGDTDNRTYSMEVFYVFTGWEQNFNSYSDNTSEDMDNASGTSWAISVIDDDDGYFSVQNNRLEIRNIESLFRTQAINIAGGPVTLEIDADERGDLDAGGDKPDNFIVNIIVDGVLTQIVENLGATRRSTRNISYSGITGDSLVIQIQARTSQDGESYYFDNISVQPE
ncbi:MAG: PKD domain-containing protein [Opitutales bacterium]